MDAKKCDRCGRFYVEVPANAIQEAVHSLTEALRRFQNGEAFDLFSRMKGHADLCIDCTEALRKWCNVRELIE